MKPSKRRFGFGILVCVVLLHFQGTLDFPPAGDATAREESGAGFSSAGENLPEALATLNLDGNGVFPAAFIDSVLAAEGDLPVPIRIGAWARRFVAVPGPVYLCDQ